MLPLKVASAFAGFLARCFGPLLKAKKIAERNIQRIYPEHTPQDHQRLLRGMWDNFGRVIAEYFHSSHILKQTKSPKTQQQPYLQIEGGAILEQIVSSKKPAIFFTAHLANWQMVTLAAQLYRLPLVQIYRSANNKWIDWFMRYLQLKAVSEVVTKSPQGTKHLLQTLLKGKSIFVLADQKMNEGVSVPFMGYPAMTAPGIGKLAQKLQCPLIPAQVIRVAGVHFKVIFHPPLSLEGSLDAVMRRVNATIEGWVQQHPEQWFWVHDRWGF